MGWTTADLNRVLNRKAITVVRPPKWRNQKVQVDGYTFDSKREAQYYAELRLREKAGEITKIVVHPPYALIVNGLIVGKYTPDFQFLENERVRVIDVKSPASKTEAYQLRKRVFEAVHGLHVEEVA